jgi:hypothetical protein
MRRRCVRLAMSASAPASAQAASVFPQLAAVIGGVFHSGQIAIRPRPDRWLAVDQGRA